MSLNNRYRTTFSQPRLILTNILRINVFMRFSLRSSDAEIILNCRLSVSYVLPVRNFRLSAARLIVESLMARLTKRTVDQIAPGLSESIHWDDELRGFGVRIWPSGRKVYLAMTRVKGRLRKITIGPHGPITAEKARVRAHEIISESKGRSRPHQGTGSSAQGAGHERAGRAVPHGACRATV